MPQLNTFWKFLKITLIKRYEQMLVKIIYLTSPNFVEHLKVIHNPYEFFRNLQKCPGALFKLLKPAVGPVCDLRNLRQGGFSQCNLLLPVATEVRSTSRAVATAPRWCPCRPAPPGDHPRSCPVCSASHSTCFPLLSPSRTPSRALPVPTVAALIAGV